LSFAPSLTSWASTCAVRNTDYVRVGAPLQLLLAVVTSAAIALYWGV
jgi:di/tricarboxylate transporter